MFHYLLNTRNVVAEEMQNSLPLHKIICNKPRPGTEVGANLSDADTVGS